MSTSALVALAVAVVCFHDLLWRWRISRRLGCLERQSRLDPQTGLGSGDWLSRERWPAALRSGRPLGVLFIDLDQLKLTNDIFGHAFGDQYIRTSAEELCRALRKGVDELFRLHTAGDEFVALLHGPIQDITRFAWILLVRLRSRGVLASIGLAYSAVTEYVPVRVELQAQAEAACKRAKQCGGNCVVVWPHQSPIVAPVDKIESADEAEERSGLASAHNAGRGSSAEAIPVPIDDGMTRRIQAEHERPLLAGMNSAHPNHVAAIDDGRVIGGAP